MVVLTYLEVDSGTTYNVWTSKEDLIQALIDNLKNVLVDVKEE